MRKLFNVKFTYTHTANMQVVGDDEETVLQAIANDVANEVPDFKIVGIETIVEELDEAMLVSNTNGVLN